MNFTHFDEELPAHFTGQLERCITSSGCAAAAGESRLGTANSELENLDTSRTDSTIPATYEASLAGDQTDRCETGRETGRDTARSTLHEYVVM
mgnify:CR=1 FL=1